MLNLELIREQFPALASGAIHLDNPGGTQVARQSFERIRYYYQHTNANHGGLFRTSRDSDAMVMEARRAVADWLNAVRPEEIVFGANMTTLTLHMSRSLAHLLQSGDEIVLTHLDHDANVAPWLLIAQERGCTIRWVDFRPEDCTLDLDTLERAISPRTKIVAVGYASNAVGTINDVKRVAQIAHSVGALCYVDAVQYAAHGVVDVQALDCDFLVCSAYKFFGPHAGILYGKYELLDRLTAYKVRTSSSLPPEKWETGTANFEAIAGTLGALDYFEWLGKTFGSADKPDQTRREVLMCGMEAARAYEQELSQALISGLQTIPDLRIWGITDPARLDQRVSTVSFTLDGHAPDAIAAALGNEGIYVWNGNFYALEVTTTLGLEERGGLVRIGAVHYNTRAEIDCLIETLHRIVHA
ncbi:MAG: cysteine desulfurase-like protein [Anaerolineae bacterium]|nr:cysteine desulfurase-like protein [Anaerolineae bacterium]